MTTPSTIYIAARLRTSDSFLGFGGTASTTMCDTRSLYLSDAESIEVSCGSVPFSLGRLDMG
jgi:hypothetical protein